MDEKTEAIQAVVDRVGAYQDGAPAGTVEKELRDGFTEAGVDVTDEQVALLVDAIDADGAQVDAATVLD